MDNSLETSGSARITNQEWCIICLGTYHLKKMQSNYEINGKPENYIQMIEECFKFKIVTSPETEYCICRVCRESLRFCCTFRRNVKSCSSRFKYEMKTSFPIPKNSISSIPKICPTANQNDAGIANSKNIPLLILNNVFSVTLPQQNSAEDETPQTSAEKLNEVKVTVYTIFSSDRCESPPQVVEPQNMLSGTSVDENVHSEASETITICTTDKEIRKTNDPPFFPLTSTETISGFIDHCVMNHYGSITVDNEISHGVTNDTELEDSNHFSFVNDHDYNDDNWSVTSMEMERATKCNWILERTKKQAHVYSDDHLCEICGKILKAKHSFDYHVTTHNKSRIKMWNCPFCTKLFFDKNNAKAHRAWVHENGLKCLHCPKSFRSKLTRIRHMSDLHGYQCKKYPCAVCKKVFLTPSTYRQHIKLSHLKYKEFPCTKCSDAFYHKCDLEDHMVKHTKIPRHICGICGRSVASKRGLKSHLMSHVGIGNKVTCKICGKEYSKNSLSGHIKNVHSKNVST